MPLFTEANGSAAGLAATVPPLNLSNPGWPVPTTTLNWEADTRLRRLESGIDEPAPAYVTPNSFGAMGDGVTDDTAALQAAANAADMENFVLLLPPNNNYLITQPITIGNIVIQGSCPRMQLQATPNPAPGTSNILIGNGAMKAAILTTQNGAEIRQVTFSSTAALGTNCMVPIIYGPWNIWIDNIHTFQTGGIYGDGLNRSVIINVAMNVNTDYAYYFPNQALVWGTNTSCRTNVAANSWGKLSGVTLNAPLTAGVVYNTIPVTALNYGLTRGQVIVIEDLETGATPEPVVLNGAAPSGTTSIPCEPFTPQVAHASGATVQNYNLCYVSSGQTFQLQNAGSGPNWAIPYFTYRAGNHFYLNLGVNGAGKIALYFNNVGTTETIGFNNTSAPATYTDYVLWCTNGNNNNHFIAGPYGAGAKGTIRINNSNRIFVSGIQLVGDPSQTEAIVHVLGNSTTICITGNQINPNNPAALPVIFDESTNSNRDSVYANNAGGYVKGATNGTTIQIGGAVPAGRLRIAGFERAWAMTPPAVPASGTTFNNPFPFDAMVYLTGFTGLSQINLFGAGGNIGPQTSFLLRIGIGVTLTYTTAGTWQWFAAA